LLLNHREATRGEESRSNRRGKKNSKTRHTLGRKGGGGGIIFFSDGSRKDSLCGLVEFLAAQRRYIVLPVRYELNLYMLCRRK
jgi:hypothetical protein